MSDAGDTAAATTVVGEALSKPELTGADRASLLSRRAALRSAAGEHTGALEDLEEAFKIERDAYAAPLARALAAAAEAAEGDPEKARLLRLRHGAGAPALRRR